MPAEVVSFALTGALRGRWSSSNSLESKGRAVSVKAKLIGLSCNTVNDGYDVKDAKG